MWCISVLISVGVCVCVCVYVVYQCVDPYVCVYVRVRCISVLSSVCVYRCVCVWYISVLSSVCVCVCVCVCVEQCVCVCVGGGGVSVCFEVPGLSFAPPPLCRCSSWACSVTPWVGPPTPSPPQKNTPPTRPHRMDTPPTPPPHRLDMPPTRPHGMDTPPSVTTPSSSASAGTWIKCTAS